MSSVRQSCVHPAWVRATHWINVLAVSVMVTSGWRIYDASPLYALRFPHGITLGGWLAGALLWHFAFMWLLAANGLAWLGLNLATGRFHRRFLPLDPRGVWRDLRSALTGRLSHADPRHYNALQRLAYVFIAADLVVLVMSGLTLWKPVQLPLLREMLGDYEGARRVHFFAMTALVAFAAGHAAVAVLVPRSLVAMVRGR